MSNMNDLYNKVAGDPILQQKFSRIMADAEQAGQEATEEKLLAFAWEAGFEVSIAEIQAFFQGMAAQTEGELSDAELDQVAGVLTPAGGLLGMPLAASLLKAGAGVGVLVTYLTSMALLPALRVPMEIGIYGGRLALLRITASLALPLLAGFTAQLLVRLARAAPP